VDTLDTLERVQAKLASMDSLIGATDHGTTKALYGKDPDGLEFEVCWLVPADLLTDDVQMGTLPLNLEAEKERYGAQTRGGVGISFPAKV
jgi:catechol-2,3-dioxygenase